MSGKLFIPILLAMILSGCAISNAPSNWLPEKSDVAKDPYGAWINIELKPDYVLTHNTKKTLQERDFDDLSIFGGEFIAVTDSSVFFLSKARLIETRFNHIEHIRIEIYQFHSTKFWLGFLWGLPWGLWDIITIPAWLLVGVPSIAGDSWADKYDEDQPNKYRWRDLSKFARYPQGLPKDLDLTKIKSKNMMSD